MSSDHSAGPPAHRRDSTAEQVVYDWQEYEGPTQAITTATAQLLDSDPMALPPIQQYVDVDSVTALLAGSYEVELAFEYDDVTVTIGSDGKLVATRTS